MRKGSLQSVLGISIGRIIPLREEIENLCRLVIP